MTDESAEPPGAKLHHEEEGLETLYRDVIFEHYRRPHNKGPVQGAQIVTKGNNPVCGDRITVYGKLSPDGKLTQVGFDGKGCAICMACSSMMTEAVKGKSLEEAEETADLFKKMMRNEIPFQAPENMPDMEALSGVRKFSVRVKCATLAWTTLRNGIVQYEAARHNHVGAKDEGSAMNENQNPKPETADAAKMAAPPDATGTAAAPDTAKMASAEEIREALKNVFDPEIPINIVDLGLIYKLEAKDGQVDVAMTLTTPLCPLAGHIRSHVAAVLASLPGVKNANVNLVFDPPWTKERMTEEGKMQAAMLGFM